AAAESPPTAGSDDPMNTPEFRFPSGSPPTPTPIRFPWTRSRVPPSNTPAWPLAAITLPAPAPPPPTHAPPAPVMHTPPPPRPRRPSGAGPLPVAAHAPPARPTPRPAGALDARFGVPGDPVAQPPPRAPPQRVRPRAHPAPAGVPEGDVAPRRHPDAVPLDAH